MTIGNARESINCEIENFHEANLKDQYKLVVVGTAGTPGGMQQIPNEL
jgi:hypothetical protein